MNINQIDKEDNFEIEDILDETEASIEYDIASYPSDLTLSVVHEMWTNRDIYIPDFQRNFVWNIKQSSILIESFLLGLPVPQVFFYVDEENKNMIIDGQQRIMSIVYYIDGYFGSENFQGKKQVFRLKGLNERSPYANKRFEELTEMHQRKLKSAVLRAINIRQLNPKDETTSIYHIFERLNTGGTPLTPQEIRNCVFRGDFVDVLRTLNQNKDWRKIIGKETYDIHQKDIELILRIFCLTFYHEKYDKPMKEFLNRIMVKEKNGTSNYVKSFNDYFKKISRIIIDKFGTRPFHIRGPLSSSALDSIFAILIQNGNIIPNDLHDRYENLKKDEIFINTTTRGTSDIATVKERFKIVKKYLIG
jgi:uncharacterized protein with ParB-like and HNH nuclease domain